MSEKRRYRWFRFSLRALLVLLTLCASVAGYVAPKLSLIRDRREARLDKDLLFRGETLAPWPLRMLGEPGVADIRVMSPMIPGYHVSPQRQALRDRLQDIFPEAEIVKELSPFCVVRVTEEPHDAVRRQGNQISN